VAFQVGGEVSLNELATTLRIDVKTVARYLDLLEKSFIIHQVQGFNRNLRSEMTKKGKVFFWDNGIRNAVISNFNPPELRDDMGRLWENFLFLERLKKRSYLQIYGQAHFWRTYDQKELDLVEERDGGLFGFEFKWGSGRTRPPKLWHATYPRASFEIITPDNFLAFVGH